MNEIQPVLCARHPDIKQSAFFLNLRVIACGHIGRDATIGRVQQINAVPFLALCRMNG